MPDSLYSDVAAVRTRTADKYISVLKLVLETARISYQVNLQYDGNGPFNYYSF